MTIEHMGSFRESEYASHFSHRMRRAKALLQQERLSRGETVGLEDLHMDGERKKHKEKGGWFPFRQKHSEEDPKHPERYSSASVQEMLQTLDKDIVSNKDRGVRWVAPYLLMPPLPTDAASRQLQQNDDQEMTRGKTKRDAVNSHQVNTKSKFFQVSRGSSGMDWKEEYDKLVAANGGNDDAQLKPPVDYVTHEYSYPPIREDLPDLEDQNEYPDYPPMKTLGQLMKDWPQDQDFPGAHERPIPEGLYHFNYSDPDELEMAREFRDAELPFKLFDVPEVTEANEKWTDDYVSYNFDGFNNMLRGQRKHGHGTGGLMDTILGSSKNEFTSPPPRASGLCQESPNNFFAFFQPKLWDVNTMGLPPVRNNDWTFAHWAEHAHYADAVALNASKPHFYWQSGVPREERLHSTSEWTFISRDLPSFSSPTETFFVFNPESQKGIQCRFGERKCSLLFMPFDISFPLY